MQANIATTYTRTTLGLKSQLIRVEVHISNGIPCFSIVGLAQTTVKESKDRVRSAIINSHFEFPSKRITINLAPANTPKLGSGFDLAIAIGILVASKQLPIQCEENYEFIGELGLSGEVFPTYPILPAAIANKTVNRALVVAKDNAIESQIVENDTLFYTPSLATLAKDLLKQNLPKIAPIPLALDKEKSYRFHDIKGQTLAKKALMIAASGNHNLLMIGPPGSGKTLLASKLNVLLPKLSLNQALECQTLYSLDGKTQKRNWFSPPFRAPHHSASHVAIVGGGNPPSPGEISLAHNGILFLDELPEFDRRVIECLREPLESKEILISRQGYRIEYPAKFQLLLAMNPCPCGYWGVKGKICSCSSSAINRYQRKLSGPFLDRIDLQLNVLPISSEVLLSEPSKKARLSDQALQKKIALVQKRQFKRQGKLNQHLQNKDIDKYCVLTQKDKDYLAKCFDNFSLSNRSLHRVLKVARTIADFDNQANINRHHLNQALSFRLRDNPS